MDQTPRLRSAFPTTPQTTRRSGGARYDGSPGSQRKSYGEQRQSLPSIPTLEPSSLPPSDPLIPDNILDAPTQRLFAVCFYVALCAWRFYDFSMLNDLEEQSLWLFMKWVAIDGVFLFGLPGLRIPWLEWSSSTMLLLFCFHAVADAMLMFRIPIPIAAGFSALGRSLWGAYELAVNEHNVNPEAIKFNDSLILGRQVVHILPEGSAILNPEREAFCIDGTRLEARLPIMINSTNPISMTILRTDLENHANETIQISKSQIKTMHKEASRLISYSENPNEPKTLYFSVKKPGLYVLAKVVDESNLEVARKRLAHTVVVPCPNARVSPSGLNRCRGELSNVELEITGAPPLTLKYRKKVNKVAQDATFENILPEDFSSPLAKQGVGALVVPHKVDAEWAKPRTITVPLSESLSTSGRWLYSIEEVRDGFGNQVTYSNRDHEDQERHLVRAPHLHQEISVHERPTVNLQGCSPQRPLKVAKGKTAKLPIQYGSTGRGELADTSYHLDLLFSPQSDVSATGDHMSAAQKKSITMKNSKEVPEIKEAGLYTITGIRSDFCAGEVLEPASCILQNPPQPQLSLDSEEIFDKCANSSVGLRVHLDLIGTPPFQVHYHMTKDGDRHYSKGSETINGLRGQFELTPREAGLYTYDFVEISDAVYKEQKLSGKMLRQDVKPSASAKFVNAGAPKVSCIDDAVSFDVELQGEGPFTLQYELVHGGRRAKFTREDVSDRRIEITTPPLKDGGDYTLALASITDSNGCKEFLKDNNEARIAVRHQKPKVGFRTIDGQRSVNTLEGKKVELPLRLEGDPPWHVRYLDASGGEQIQRVENANDKVAVSKEGLYELTHVIDSTCPGTVDETASTFRVSWIARPTLRIAESESVQQRANTFVKSDVCEGDEDALNVVFTGSPNFHAHYTEHVKPEKGTVAPKNKELRAALNVAPLRMDTAQPGFYEYTFNKLEDANYDHSAKHFQPLNIQQRVHSRPSAAFANPGKTYSYCSVQSDGEEVIPILLHGLPPFDVEVEIKHQGTSRPETYTLTSIPTHKHDVRIPHARVQPGRSSVHLRRVSDSNGCARSLDSTTPRVQISVHDAPTITPLEAQTDYCVGEPINFGLSGVAPFTIHYTFEGSERKATVSSGTTFRRLAEKPGQFVITGIQDSASTCNSKTNITKAIHGLPSVRVSKGRDAYVDIHEGGSTEILFEFGGVPPFEFTYTRSSNTEKHGKKAGAVLDMHSEVSDEYSLRVKASEEGTYEVVAIKDRFCAYAKPGVRVDKKEQQKRLQW